MYTAKQRREKSCVNTYSVGLFTTKREEPVPPAPGRERRGPPTTLPVVRAFTARLPGSAQPPGPVRRRVHGRG